jgi:hypothetical protein
VRIEQFPIIIRQSRVRAALLTLGSAAFVAGGGWSLLLARAGDRLVLGLSTAFFGVCLATGLMMLLWPGRLVVDQRGITQTSLRRTHHFAWRDVDNFRVWRVGLTNRFVAFDYLGPTPDRRFLRAFNRAMGADAALAPGWTMRAEELAALLNEARQVWMKRAQA